MFVEPSKLLDTRLRTGGLTSAAFVTNVILAFQGFHEVSEHHTNTLEAAGVKIWSLDIFRRKSCRF